MDRWRVPAWLLLLRYRFILGFFFFFFFFFWSERIHEPSFSLAVHRFLRIQARALATEPGAAKADVSLFLDPESHTAQYCVACPETGECAVIDTVLGYDVVSGRTKSVSMRVFLSVCLSVCLSD